MFLSQSSGPAGMQHMFWQFMNAFMGGNMPRSDPLNLQIFSPSSTASAVHAAPSQLALPAPPVSQQSAQSVQKTNDPGLALLRGSDQEQGQTETTPGIPQVKQDAAQPFEPRAAESVPVQTQEPAVQAAEQMVKDLDKRNKDREVQASSMPQTGLKRPASKLEEPSTKAASKKPAAFKAALKKPATQGGLKMDRKNVASRKWHEVRNKVLAATGDDEKARAKAHQAAKLARLAWDKKMLEKMQRNMLNGSKRCACAREKKADLDSLFEANRCDIHLFCFCFSVHFFSV